MIYSTAPYSTGIDPTIGSLFQWFGNYEVVPNIEESFQNSDTILSAQRVVNESEGPIFFPSIWLPQIEIQIANSIASLDLDDIEHDCSELSENIADTAIGFFQAISDLIPVEPYIYSSKKGDLVAEFNLPDVNINSIIGSSFIFLFKGIKGNLKEKIIDFKNIYSDEDRKKIRHQVSEFISAQ